MRSRQSGFTIIEVTLVLAVAGLIFLTVFFAVPQIQKAQRDTQRKATLLQLAQIVATYKDDNRGKALCSDSFHATWCGFQASTDPTYTAPSWITFTTAYYRANVASLNLRKPDNLGLTYIYGISHRLAGYTNASAANDSTIPAGAIIIVSAAKCVGPGFNSNLSNDPGEVAVWIKLEQSAAGYCIDT